MSGGDYTNEDDGGWPESTARSSAQSPEYCPIPELEKVPVWLIWKSVPNGEDKRKKMPFYADRTPRRGTLDAREDRGRFVDYQTARKALTSAYAGVGVALGAVPGTDLHIAGIDLDNVRDPESGELDARAKRIIKAAGSYTEVSPSGCGVKIFGVGAIGTTKRTNCSAGLEIYDCKRFFTVTGDAVGEADKLADLSDGAKVARREFPGPEATPEGEPADAAGDDVFVEGERNNSLTRLAGKLRYAGASEAEVLAGLKSFNTARCKPPLKAKEVASIAKSIAKYSAPDAAQPAGIPQAEVLTLQQMLAHHAMLGGSHVVDLRDPEVLFSKEEFYTQYAASKMRVGDKDAPVARVWQCSPTRLTLNGLNFDPDAGAVIRDGKRAFLNLYQPPVWEAADPALAAPLVDHIRYLVPRPEEHERVLDYLAHMIQRPGERPHFHIALLTARTGTGRNLLFEHVWHMLGPRQYVELDLARLLTDQFNAELSQKICVGISEAKMPGSDRFSMKDRFKALLTDSRIIINDKNRRQRWCRFFGHGCKWISAGAL